MSPFGTTPGVAALARRSVELIHEHQAPSGAYPASPTFAPYRYCWFRDGSFIADSMSRVGQVESAEAFFGWCARVIVERRERVAAGERLHARYELDGSDDTSPWPKVQHDGYGLWLWALRSHADRHTRSVEPFAEAAEVACGYLAGVWREPCVDWWEEREGVHAATLACVWAGLAAWQHEAADDVLAALAGTDGARLDASLLVLDTPLDARYVDPRRLDPLVSPGGGVHRHLEDTYYGGGEWILLTALLGWARARRGDVPGARQALGWVAAHATPEGLLPEQSQDHLLAPGQLDAWVKKWGEPPCPLLWSHAMFLALAHELGDAQ